MNKETSTIWSSTDIYCPPCGKLVPVQTQMISDAGEVDCPWCGNRLTFGDGCLWRFEQDPNTS